MHPTSLKCMMYYILQDSVLWFSNGGTKSHLHNDKVENINCLFSGQKTWFFVDAVSSYFINHQHFLSDSILIMFYYLHMYV